MERAGMSGTGPDHSHLCPSCQRHVPCQRYYERECPWPDEHQCAECDNNTQGWEDSLEKERIENEQ